MAVTRGTKNKKKAATAVVPAVEAMTATVGNVVVVSSESTPISKSSTKTPFQTHDSIVEEKEEEKEEMTEHSSPETKKAQEKLKAKAVTATAAAGTTANKAKSIKAAPNFKSSPLSSLPLDANLDIFNFLSIDSKNHLHQFVSSFITKCANNNTNNNKKVGKGENRDLPEQITTATINFICQECPELH